jgi:hypothetical protein
MGLLTRSANLLDDIGRQVPAGSRRDRAIGALARGVEGTQNLLAGKYAQAIQGAMSPANTAQYAPLAYGLIGAGGSVAGNVMSGEDKDPGRILAEAAGAGLLGVGAGKAIGGLGEIRQAYLPKHMAEMNELGTAAGAYRNRASKAGEAGARSTQAAARQKLVGIVDQMAEKEAVLNEGNRFTRGYQALGMGAVPLAAGLGGMIGGGVSNIAQMAGLPGFNQNVITDPELAGSSNTPGARSSTPTLRYIS